jgi:hypothetical protein
MHNLLALLPLLLILCSCSSASAPLNTILPSPFTSHEIENIGILPITAAGSITDQQGEIVYNAIATYSHQIIQEKKLKLNLIERLDLDRILDEFKFQESGITDTETLVELGKIKNLQKLILSTFVYDKASKNHYVMGDNYISGVTTIRIPA